jgi:phenylacetate-CoA ligase
MDINAYLAKHIVYPMGILKNRSQELDYLNEFEKSQYRSADEIRHMQLNKLNKLLKHAYRNCPYYTKLMNESGIVPEDIKELGDAARLPMLSKESIQENMTAMIAGNIPAENLIKDKSGGSTGKPLVFYYDKSRLASRQAATIRHYRWSGWDIGIKTAIIWGAVRDISANEQNTNTWKRWIKRNFLTRRLLLDASTITEQKLKDFAVQIKQFKPQIYRGYAKSMVLFARYVQDNNLEGYNPKAIITSAEVLEDHERAFLESVFHCKVFNFYGCREVAAIASECARHEGLHVNAENLLVEVVKNNKTAGKGETGEILITDLENFAMPLIRYRIGDAGILSERNCSCGRGLPLIEKLEGRVTDFIETVEGSKISGVAICTYVITNIKGIRQVQFIQESLDRVTINIAKNHFFDQDTEKHLVKKFKDFIGTGNMTVAVNYVDEIPKTTSGKYRFVISKIDTNEERHGKSLAI